MGKVFDFVGGRKVFLLLVIAVLVALSGVLGIDKELLKWLAGLFGVGTLAIAGEDGLKGFRNGITPRSGGEKPKK